MRERTGVDVSPVRRHLSRIIGLCHCETLIAYLKV